MVLIGLATFHRTTGIVASAGEQRSSFRAGVDVVRVNVTVTDPSRRFVTDLGPTDFRIFADGRPQKLTFFQTGLLGREVPHVRPEEPPFVWRRLTPQTGGRAFFPAVATELASVYGEICAELAGQYFLAYESTKPGRDGQFHRISVRVDRSGAVARARPGYFAPTQYLTNEPFYGSRLWAHFL